jgi:hypothetical protein
MVVASKPVACDGTVQLRSKAERVSFEVIVQSYFSGDKIDLLIWRNGKEETVSITLLPEVPLAPPTRALAPQYVVWGGLVFLTLSYPYFSDSYACSEMASGGESSSELSLYIKCESAREFPDQEIVLLSRVLSDDCNQGYDALRNLELKAVQNLPVRNLKQLMEVLRESSSDGFVRFDLRGDRSIVLKVDHVKQRQEEILKRHKIGDWCFIRE